jgi:hypothetical protein
MEEDGMNLDESFECLCYKHVTLLLVKSPESDRDLLVMEIDLEFTKGHKRTLKR